MVQRFKLSDRALKNNKNTKINMLNMLKDPVEKMGNFIGEMETILKKVK